MEKHASNEGGGDNIFSLADMPMDLGGSTNQTAQHSRSVEAFAVGMLQALNIPADLSIEPGYIQVSEPQLVELRLHAWHCKLCHRSTLHSSAIRPPVVMLQTSLSSLVNTCINCYVHA
jgi:hypothetical protein